MYMRARVCSSVLSPTSSPRYARAHGRVCVYAPLAPRVLTQVAHSNTAIDSGIYSLVTVVSFMDSSFAGGKVAGDAGRRSRCPWLCVLIPEYLLFIIHSSASAEVDDIITTSVKAVRYLLGEGLGGVGWGWVGLGGVGVRGVGGGGREVNETTL